MAAPTAVGPAGEMVAWAVPPVAVLSTVAAVSVTNPYPHVYVADFGERRSGVVRLKGVTGCAAGETLVLRHGEILQHRGLPDLKGHVDPKVIYTGNLRSAKATDVYTCSGAAGGETWAPQLTYHGFRFVEVNTSSAPAVTIGPSSLEMIHFASAVAQRAHTAFASVTLNKIQRMAVGAQASNLMTIPTDCDQRDERLGWMGDANLSGESMMLNFDLAAFFSWWVRYIGSPELRAGGTLPDVVPFQRFGGRPGDPSWTTALPTVIYQVSKHAEPQCSAYPCKCPSPTAHRRCAVPAAPCTFLSLSLSLPSSNCLTLTTVCQLWKIYGDLETFQSAGVAAVAGQIASLGEQASKGLGQMHTPYGDWCPPPATMGGGQGVKPSPSLTSAYSYVKLVREASGESAARDAPRDAPRCAKSEDLAAVLAAQSCTDLAEGCAFCTSLLSQRWLMPPRTPHGRRS